MAVVGLGMKREWLARGFLGLTIGLMLVAVASGWRAYRSGLLLHARMAEQGGWSPDSISASVGQPLHLRLTSDDVTHSFAVGQTDWPVVDVHPGEVTEVTLTFDHPGKYVFYCTRWCGADHWRMRGTIEVAGADDLDGEPVLTDHTPLYAALNLDIDAPHPASAAPPAKPSAVTGQVFLGLAPADYRSTSYLRSRSPAEVWQALRKEAALQKLSDSQVWDVAAALWQSTTSPQMLELGQELYAQNCAACHGEGGAGNGVFANRMEDQDSLPDAAMSGQELQTPTDFTDAGAMLGASPALLQGKILRGGMGTGMPYWGPVFTEVQIWAIVDYLYTFQFDY